MLRRYGPLPCPERPIWTIRTIIRSATYVELCVIQHNSTTHTG